MDVELDAAGIEVIGVDVDASMHAGAARGGAGRRGADVE